MGRLISVFAVCLGMVSAPAFAQDQQAFAFCQQLDRPNIDCACVARRVGQYRAVAPTPEGADLVLAQYAYVLGQEGQPLDEAYERVAGGPDGLAALMDLEAAFDSLDGELGTIDEFEGPCVIKGVEPATLPSPETDSQAALYADACVVAAGQSAARSCACEAVQLQALVGPQQLQAYRLSFSMYPGDVDEDAALMRAEHMQISPARYRELESAARSAINPRVETIRNYCSAMMWADEAQGFTLAEREAVGVGAVERGVGGGAALAAMQAEAEAAAEEARRQTKAAREAGLLQAPDSEQLTAVGQAAQAMSAATLLQQGCEGSDIYCACLSERFTSATASASDGARMLAAITLVSDGLDQATMMRAARSADADAQMEMGQIFPLVMNIPDQCGTQATVAAANQAADDARGQGDARDRYLALCAYEQGEDADSICECAANHFANNLNESEFDMLVRIQAAGLEGQGGFEGFAGEMGMSEDEAGQAVVANPRLMETMMGVRGACMGGGLY
jgi:hypothetical protein